MFYQQTKIKAFVSFFVLFLFLAISPSAQAQKDTKSEAVLKVEKTIAENESFLEKNAQKEGVYVTASGLQYEIIQRGDMRKNPTINSTVKTHYHGTLIDGSVFDSSRERGVPNTFPLSKVIKGWQEGIPLMTRGGIYRFYIPYQLAYGLKDMPKIPGGSTLIFEVVLLEIVK